MIVLLLTLFGLTHAPAETALRTLKFAWPEIPGALRYEVQVSTDPRVEQQVLRKTVTEPEASVQVAPGQWYFRVRGIDRTETPGEWSKIHSMRVLLVAPPRVQAIESGLIEAGPERLCRSARIAQIELDGYVRARENAASVHTLRAAWTPTCTVSPYIELRFKLGYTRAPHHSVTETLSAMETAGALWLRPLSSVPTGLELQGGLTTLLGIGSYPRFQLTLAHPWRTYPLQRLFAGYAGTFFRKDGYRYELLVGVGFDLLR